MTTTLLTGLLKSLALNIGRGHADVHIVETGRVFLPKSDEAEAPIYGVDRRPTRRRDRCLRGGAAGPAAPCRPGHERRAGPHGLGRCRAPGAWADAVAIVQHLADELHVEIEVQQAQSCRGTRAGALRSCSMA